MALPFVEPTSGVRVERAPDDRVERGGDLRANVAWRRRRAADPRRRERGRRLAAPRALAGQRLVQDEAQAVDVRGRRGRRAGRLLRAEVVDRAEGRARDGALGVGGEPGDPEVGDHRPPVAREQDVAGLDVAMDDPADVGDAQRTGDVEPDPRGVRRAPAGRPGAGARRGPRPR